MSAPIDVFFVLPRGSLILDWAGPAEALRFANTELPARAPAFRLHFAAPRPQSQSSVGACIADLAPLPERLEAPAWVVLVGRTSVGQRRGDGESDREDRLVVDWLRRLRPGEGGVRLVSVCSGALLAASAGLLAKRRATTHHADLDELARRAPDAVVVPDRVFVQDGEVWSSAGVTAGIDLALHLVAEQCGPLVAARVAQRMAVALRRGPDDPQLSPFLAHRQHFNARLHRVQDAVSRTPHEDWSVTRMAELAHTTPRTLTRLFGEHAGTTPLAYLRGIRLALARSALEAGSSVTAAADAAGFHSDLQLRRAWRAAGLSGSPGALRESG
jgi:transcriptional regulator GlxA family with amidase domain